MKLIDRLRRAKLEVAVVRDKIACMLPEGVTVAQAEVVSAIADGMDRQADIADSTGKDAPTVCRIVDRLIDKGIANRSANEACRRSVRVTLTDEGRELLELIESYK